MLRVADVARYLGVSVQRGYQLVKGGQIPAVRVGGAIRIPRAAWERWLSEKTEAACRAVLTDG